MYVVCCMLYVVCCVLYVVCMLSVVLVCLCSTLSLSLLSRTRSWYDCVFVAFVCFYVVVYIIYIITRACNLSYNPHIMSDRQRSKPGVLVDDDAYLPSTEEDDESDESDLDPSTRGRPACPRGR